MSPLFSPTKRLKRRTEVALLSLPLLPLFFFFVFFFGGAKGAFAPPAVPEVRREKPPLERFPPLPIVSFKITKRE